MDSVLRAFYEDKIVGDYSIPPAQWRDIKYETPYGRIICVKTPYGMFLFPMVDRLGNIVPWEQNDIRHAVQFNYEDVTHWVRLV